MYPHDNQQSNFYKKKYKYYRINYNTKIYAYKILKISTIKCIYKLKVIIYTHRRVIYKIYN